MQLLLLLAAQLKVTLSKKSTIQWESNPRPSSFWTGRQILYHCATTKAQTTVENKFDPKKTGDALNWTNLSLIDFGKKNNYD